MRCKAKGKGKEDGEERERERERKLRNGQKKRAKETMRDWKKEAKEKTGQEWRRWVAGREGGGGTKSDEGNNDGKFYGIASSGGNCRVCTAEKDVEILKRGRGDGLVEGGEEIVEIDAIRRKDVAMLVFESNFSYGACSIFYVEHRGHTYTHTYIYTESYTTVVNTGIFIFRRWFL